eukprot:15458914-Alexandrium_andersonii.AAC.1
MYSSLALPLLKAMRAQATSTFRTRLRPRGDAFSQIAPAEENGASRPWWRGQGADAARGAPPGSCAR